MAAAPPQILTTASTNLFVDVTTGGKPESDALVKANIIPAGLGPSHPGYNLVLSEYAPGQYATTFANFESTIPLASFVSTCNSIMSFVSDACKFNKPVATYMLTLGCAQVATAAALVGSPATGVAVLALCEKAFVASTAACALVDNYTPPNAQATCHTIASVIQFFDPDGVLVKISANKDGRNGSINGQVAGNTPEARFAIALPAPPCVIQSLVTNPVQPAAFQSYTATVHTTCGGSDNIWLEMYGTDGYQTSTQCSGTNVCNLGVPGAEAGVVDTITATTSSGDTRTTAFVFR